MKREELENLLEIGIAAALEASEEILEVYGMDDFSVEIKEDNSPLTIADKRSNARIEKHLKQTGIPILSEEGDEPPFYERKGWETLWVVDPLDGTKEFVKRNGEFTVNIALVHNNRPIIGVIYNPLAQDLYYSEFGLGSYKNQNRLSVKDTPITENIICYLIPVSVYM